VNGTTYHATEISQLSGFRVFEVIPDPQARLTLRAEIDALVARLYNLTVEEFQHILTTFPLVDDSVKSQTLNTYRELVKGTAI